MARKWIIPNTPYYAWNLEPCEETLLIAWHEEIKPFISANEQGWSNDFEQRYYLNGDGVAARFIDEINVIRRRRGLEMIELQETDVGEYARTPDRLAKVKKRSELRDEFTNQRGKQRGMMVDHARAEIALLLPPHRTLDEVEADRIRRMESGMLTPSETAARRAANTLAHGPRRRVELEPDVAVRMLTLTTDEVLRADIISAMSGEDAVVAAETTEDEGLRNLLLRHALAALTGQVR